MEKIIEFIGNNYAWFLTITIILLFGLIGYIYDNRKDKSIKEEKNESVKENEVVIEEVKTEEIKNEEPVLLDGQKDEEQKPEEIRDEIEVQ